MTLLGENWDERTLDSSSACDFKPWIDWMYQELMTEVNVTDVWRNCIFDGTERISAKEPS